MISLLILFRLIFALYCENHTERVNNFFFKYTHSEAYSRWYKTKTTLQQSLCLKPEDDTEKGVYQTV